MKTYEVLVGWEMAGYIKVKADSPEDALEEANARLDEWPLPDNGEYVSGSFEVYDEDPVPIE